MISLQTQCSPAVSAQMPAQISSSRTRTRWGLCSNSMRRHELPHGLAWIRCRSATLISRWVRRILVPNTWLMLLSSRIGLSLGRGPSSRPVNIRTLRCRQPVQTSLVCSNRNHMTARSLICKRYSCRKAVGKEQRQAASLIG